MKVAEIWARFASPIGSCKMNGIELMPICEISSTGEQTVISPTISTPSCRGLMSNGPAAHNSLTCSLTFRKQQARALQPETKEAQTSHTNQRGLSALQLRRFARTI